MLDLLPRDTEVNVSFFNDVLVSIFFLGFGVYSLVGAIWPGRFAYPYLQDQLQREKQADERKVTRITTGVGGVGLLLIGVAATANAVVPSFLLYIVAGIALGLLAIPLLVNHFS
jgi:hypothetical protein